MDVGYTSHKIDQNTGAGRTAAENLSRNIKRNVVGSNGLSTSRLGFRGTEDLGNGNTAGFTFETGLAPAGTTTAQASTHGGPAGATATNGSHALSTFDNRQAFVSLANKDMGSLAIGRQYSVIHGIQAAYNAGGSNNVVGDVAYTQAEVGATAPTNGISGLRADSITSAAYVLRSANAVSYTAPTFVPGLALKAAVVRASTDSNGSTVANKATAYSAQYTTGPLSLGYAAIDGTQQANTLGNVGTGAIGGDGAPVTQGATQLADMKLKNNILAGSYDLGAAKLFYTHLTLKMQMDRLADYKRTANKVGVSFPMGKFTPFVQYGTSKETNSLEAGFQNGSYKVKGTQVGTTYDLSKRTTAYAISGRNTGTVSGVSAVADARTNKETQYAIGVRHSF